MTLPQLEAWPMSQRQRSSAKGAETLLTRGSYAEHSTEASTYPDEQLAAVA